MWMVLGRRETLEWFGVFARHPDGSMAHNYSSSCYSLSPLQTKFLAILHDVIKWSIHHNYTCAYIFTDCLNSAKKIGWHNERHYADLFCCATMKQEISKRSFCWISKVECKGIHQTHCLAKGLWHLLFCLYSLVTGGVQHLLYRASEEEDPFPV